MLINEIFLSIQGETSTAGLPTVFVRTTGCNLRCTYCDTTYAYSGGLEMSPAEVAGTVADYGVKRVCLTGGEPLIQPAAEVQALLDLLGGYELSVETGGAVALAGYRLHPGHRWILDVKGPSSGMSGFMVPGNLRSVGAKDEVKFVLGDRSDYEWAVATVREHNLAVQTRVVFASVHGVLDPADLAEWIMADRLDVRLQVQLHKVIWDAAARGR